MSRPHFPPTDEGDYRDLVRRLEALERSAHQSGEIVTVLSYQEYASSGSKTGTSWADYPGPHDITIIKKYDDTLSKLVVFGAVGGFVTTGNTRMDIGLAFDGVDHVIGTFYFNTSGEHNNASCQDDTFAGLTAGALTGRLRWRSDGANQINTDGNDAVRLTLMEVML